jgi:hypothetical protein
MALRMARGLFRLWLILSVLWIGDELFKFFKPTIMGAAWNCLLNELGCCGFDSNRRPAWLAAL